ncbi:MAG: hypothetical protein R3Y32_06710 [Bacillota bacterium]
MKKICKKNKNVPIIAVIIISVIFGIFCFPAVAFADVYVDSYIYDCPDCESGTVTNHLIYDCSVYGCIDGTISSDVTTTCTSCSGNAVLYTYTSTTCSACSGLGYYYSYSYDGDESKPEFVKIFGCTACGGYGSGNEYNGRTFSSAFSSAITSFESYISSGTAAYGAGVITSVSSADCPSCTDGNIYSTAFSDCPVCVDGIVDEVYYTSCDICDTLGIILDSNVYTFDCPDCTDGTYTTATTTDCPNCTDGTKTTTTTSTCTSCTNGYDYSSFCLNCSGYGYYVEPIYYKNTTLVGYLLYGCTTCGGSGSSSAVEYADLDFDNITYGCGKGDCSDCVGGLIYTDTISDCTTCGGEAVLYGDTTYECPTCSGISCVFKGIDILTVLPDVAILDDSSINVSFDTYEINDVGTVEYIWVINNSIYSSSSSPNLELSSIPIGTYKAYCIVLSQYGFTTETNEFTIYCIDINDYGSLDSSDSSDNFSFTDVFSSVLGNGFSNVILITVCAVILILFLCVIFLYIKRG